MTGREYDEEYDLTTDAGLDVFTAVFAAGLTVVEYRQDGPGGGNPVITLRGSEEAHAEWMKFYQDGQP
jgi:hypothetical protein